VVLILALLGSPAALAFDPAAYTEATDTILCDCGCHPQSVAACTCGRAAEVREEIHGMVASGMSGDEVIDDFVARYGEKILISPEATGFNLLVWLGPLALLLGGMLSMLLIVRRWSRRSADGALPAPAAQPAADDPYVARLQREIEDLP
jgi:cytochrome c-type biogenesis protein CcmH